MLDRIDEGLHGWNSVSKSTRDAAEALRSYLKSGKTLRGVIINVDHALDAAEVAIKTKVWKVFVR